MLWFLRCMPIFGNLSIFIEGYHTLVPKRFLCGLCFGDRHAQVQSFRFLARRKEKYNDRVTQCR